MRRGRSRNREPGTESEQKCSDCTENVSGTSYSTPIIITSKKTIAAAAAISSTPEPKRSKLSASSSSVRLSPDDKHCFEVSNDFIASQENLSGLMPQNPHLKPLEKYPPGVRNGMKLVFDLEFTNLAIKLQGSFDPIEFNAKAGEYIWQMTTLEEMGYNVVKLKRKFDILSKISAKGKAIGDGIGENRERIRVIEGEASVGKKRMDELETELNKLEADLRSENEEVEAIKLVEKRLSEDNENMLNSFKAVAGAPWG